ncbi:MAG: transglycosylase SLT domain-containing protein [Thiolinea sp.]
MHKLIIKLAGPVLAIAVSIVFLYSPAASAAGCQVLSKHSLEKKASRYDKTIRSASSRYGVHEDLIKAVITVESCFRSTARGTSGEKGLMQLMPGTARRFSVKRGYNSWENVHGGTKYLSYLLKRYNGDTQRAIAAYNAGEGNVKPGRSIRNIGYVRKVMKAYNKLSNGKKLTRVHNPEKAYKPAKQTGQKRTLTKQQKTLINKQLNHHKKASQSTQRKHVAQNNFHVRKGYTVYEVMRQTGVPVKQIISLNGLKAPYHLKTGQRLRLR